VRITKSYIKLVSVEAMGNTQVTNALKSVTGAMHDPTITDISEFAII